ncbi:hypothetical protein KJ612_03265 [Myxococcota bacterium]|nr:hypothetical protein [Myxococcota bacterium]
MDKHARFRQGSVRSEWRFFLPCFLLVLVSMPACHRDAGTDPADAGTDGDVALPDADADADGGLVPECFDGTAEGDFPDRVIFRTREKSFNRRWYVTLSEGRIWVRPNTDNGEPAGEWRLLGTGLPAGSDVNRFDPPTAIVEISADGTWLHALSSAGVFYRGTDFNGDVHASFTWSDGWGHPAATGPGITAEFPTTFGWSVSDSQAAGVGRYEDRLGTSHSVGLGVAHLYRLGPDGRSLIFNDWWLPADWSRQICLPDRGTFLAENLSVSASTVFIVGTLGELYTRLYDFDTAGENDTLTYSFLINAASGDTRALPAEEWRRQPDITDGLITGRITITQDGQGNAARLLRVEGVRDGRTGFYFKHIFDETWSFEETGLSVCGPFLNAPVRVPPAPVEPADFPLRGTLVRSPLFGPSVSVGVDIPRFNLMCSPAEAHVLVNGIPVTVNGVPLVFPLHHVHSLVLETRPREYWLVGIAAKVRAALLLPGEVDEIDDAQALNAVRALFEDRAVVNFQGTVTPATLDLVEMTWQDPAVGVVPGNEKADPTNAIVFEASPF